MFTLIEKTSSWGTVLRHEYISQNSRTLVVILPGSNYPVQGPVFYYAAQAAEAAGLDVLGLVYGYHGAPVQPVFDEDTMHRLEEECMDAIDHCLMHSGYDQILFAGKSVGTSLQRRIAKRMPEGVCISHVMMAPRRDALSGEHPVLAFSGSEDAGLTCGQKQWMMENWKEKLVVFPGCGHSLDGAAVVESLAMLSLMTEKLECLFGDIRKSVQ